MKGEAAYEDPIREEQRRRTPKAHALIDRCWEVLQTCADEAKRKEIHGLIFALGFIARSPRDIDHDTWGGFDAEAEEMLNRAAVAA